MCCHFGTPQSRLLNISLLDGKTFSFWANFSNTKYSDDFLENKVSSRLHRGSISMIEDGLCLFPSLVSKAYYLNSLFNILFWTFIMCENTQLMLLLSIVDVVCFYFISLFTQTSWIYFYIQHSSPCRNVIHLLLWSVLLSSALATSDQRRDVQQWEFLCFINPPLYLTYKPLKNATTTMVFNLHGSFFCMVYLEEFCLSYITKYVIVDASSFLYYLPLQLHSGVLNWSIFVRCTL